MTSVTPSTGRRLPIWAFILLAAGYLAAVQLIPQLTTPDDSMYATFTDTASVVGGLWVTVGVGTVIGLVAVAAMAPVPTPVAARSPARRPTREGGAVVR